MKSDQKKVYSSKYYTNKYSSIRYKKEHLFDSEKYLLSKYLKPNASILDIGCAAGGFSQILTSIEPTISYTGIDVSEKLIAIARQDYPLHSFDVIDASKTLRYPEESFDISQAWGVTVHESEYKKLLTEAWKITKKTLIFDMRLQSRDSEILDKDVCYVLNPSGYKNYYIIANATEFLKFLMQLKPKPEMIDIFGYKGKPNKFVHLPDNYSEEIYMTGVGVTKGSLSKNSKIKIELNLPKKLKNKMLKEINQTNQDYFLKDN